VKRSIDITLNSECKSQRNLHDVRIIELFNQIFAKAAPTEIHIMKASSLVSLICCLTINGVNSLYHPAAARELPQPTHIAEALASAKQSGDATDKYVVFQEGEKYGYADNEDYEVIAATFDEVASFNDNTAWVRVDKQVGYIDETGKFIQ
jgi:hypothetical protein